MPEGGVARLERLPPDSAPPPPRNTPARSWAREAAERPQRLPGLACCPPGRPRRCCPRLTEPGAEARASQGRRPRPPSARRRRRTLVAAPEQSCSPGEDGAQAARSAAARRAGGGRALEALRGRGGIGPAGALPAPPRPPAQPGCGAGGSASPRRAAGRGGWREPSGREPFPAGPWEARQAGLPCRRRRCSGSSFFGPEPSWAAAGAAARRPRRPRPAPASRAETGGVAEGGEASRPAVASQPLQSLLFRALRLAAAGVRRPRSSGARPLPGAPACRQPQLPRALQGLRSPSPALLAGGRRGCSPSGQKGSRTRCLPAPVPPPRHAAARQAAPSPCSAREGSQDSRAGPLAPSTQCLGRLSRTPEKAGAPGAELAAQDAVTGWPFPGPSRPAKASLRSAESSCLDLKDALGRRGGGMWQEGGLGLHQAAGCDLSFLEAIYKRMQVPNRLKVAGEEEEASSFGGPEKKPLEAVLPPAFQMHVPDRLLLAEMTAGAFRPLWEKQRKQQQCLLISDLPWESAGFGETCPFLSLASQSGSQKHKRLVHPGRMQEKKTWPDNPLLALGGRRHDWLEPSFPPAPSCQYPAFPSLEGRPYTLQNSLRVLHFLGLQLLRLLWRPGGTLLSPQDTGLATEGSLDELGATEMLAMWRQLAKISGRLRRLEEECVGWRQKELLVYSALLSVCLLNLWLWLRR